ncbi:TPA: VirB10/TraB/TrbI family type IV secretion system protein [Salmonella enterica subsp. enterica serovar Muenchen]
MSDENKISVPDEPQASPAQTEDDIAALEREARARRESELLSENDEEKDPVQPAVNKLKKRKRGKATAFLAIVAVALIFLAWGGNWVWRNILWQPTEEKKQDTAPQTNKTDYRQRNDLGMAPDTVADASAPQASDQHSAAGAGQATPAAPPELNKAIFLVRRDGSATTQNPVKTRQQEMTLATASGQQTSSAATPSGQPQNTATPSPVSLTEVRRIPYNPDLYIPENTTIPCSLDRRFVSDRAGKLRCTVVKDIWSASGNTRLIEKGTTASLVYRAIAEEGMKHGQGRAFIIATKLRTRQPPYLDIPLVDTSAAGELGEAGVDGWIDSHFWERFGGALLVGMIPDLAQWASGASRNNKDDQTDYTANSREAMADMARTTLENSINIPPTLYKNQGEIINLITGQDIDFSKIYTLKLKH